MATLTVGTTARTGLDCSGTTPTITTGDEFANTGVECILIRNGSGGSITVTLDFKATPDGATVTDPTVTIADGVMKILGPWPTAYYNDSSTGRMKFTCSSVTSVTAYVFKLGST